MFCTSETKGVKKITRRGVLLLIVLAGQLKLLLSSVKCMVLWNSPAEDGIGWADVGLPVRSNLAGISVLFMHTPRALCKRIGALETVITIIMALTVWVLCWEFNFAGISVLFMHTPRALCKRTGALEIVTIIIMVLTVWVLYWEFNFAGMSALFMHTPRVLCKRIGALETHHYPHAIDCLSTGCSTDWNTTEKDTFVSFAQLNHLV